MLKVDQIPFSSANNVSLVLLGYLSERNGHCGLEVFIFSNLIPHMKKHSSIIHVCCINFATCTRRKRKQQLYFLSSNCSKIAVEYDWYSQFSHEPRTGLTVFCLWKSITVIFSRFKALLNNWLSFCVFEFHFLQSLFLNFEAELIYEYAGVVSFLLHILNCLQILRLTFFS